MFTGNKHKTLSSRTVLIKPESLNKMSQEEKNDCSYSRQYKLHIQGGPIKNTFCVLVKMIKFFPLNAQFPELFSTKTLGI